MAFWEQLFTISGKSIDLVALEPNHLHGLWHAAKPKEIWAFTASKITSKNEMETTIDAALREREKGVQYPFVVVEKKHGHTIGSTRFLEISESNRTVEIGWTWYHPDFWRTRVNTECKFMMLHHAFEVWEVNRVQFKTDSRNIRSQNAIVRLGAVKEGIIRKDKILPDGYVRDTVCYSIIREEWPEIKIQLLEKLNVDSTI